MVKKTMGFEVLACSLQLRSQTSIGFFNKEPDIHERRDSLIIYYIFI